MGERTEHYRVSSPSTRPRPPHLRGTYLVFVALGGAVGAASREGLSLVIPRLGDIPVAILIINVLGAFLLGYLFEAIAHRGGEGATGRNLKLLLGTGFCGGFTTYSALATDTALLAVDGRAWLAASYALGTVLLGACATWAGIAIAGGLRSRAQPRPAAQGSAL